VNTGDPVHFDAGRNGIRVAAIAVDRTYVEHGVLVGRVSATSTTVRKSGGAHAVGEAAGPADTTIVVTGLRMLNGRVESGIFRRGREDRIRDAPLPREGAAADSTDDVPERVPSTVVDECVFCAAATEPDTVRCVLVACNAPA
jgi:hypothetical protein